MPPRHGRRPILQYQPFKTLYVAYFAFSLVFVKIPLWTAWYTPRSHRYRPSWTLKRNLIVRTIQELFTMKVDFDSVQPPLSEPAGELKDAKFTWIDPLPDDLFAGEVREYANKTGVKPVRTAGYWLLKAGTKWEGLKAKPGEKTVMHFHGGAYTTSSAKPSDVTSNFMRTVLLHSHDLRRTLGVEYRLSASDPNPAVNPYPAALLDAIAAYRYLVLDAGFAPANIVIAGDSAGGGLATALVRYLLENAFPSLPPPGRLVVASPWVDMSMSRRGPGSSVERNGPVDIFGVSDEDPFALYGCKSYLGPLDMMKEIRTNRYLSPLSLTVVPRAGTRIFEGYPETYVIAGGAERLQDDAEAMVVKLREDGVQAVRDIPPDAVHDFVVFTWHEPEHTDVLRRLAKWIDDIKPAKG
ncbi:alpha/beta-hydrolase [Trametes polyzona]|nr:alpha/beta-hydrolase [Trametes polyzona]